MTDGRSLVRFRTRTAQALFIYLACRPERHRRESLMALLWPDLPSSSAQQNLRQNLYLLRQSIPDVASLNDGRVPLVLADHDTLQLNQHAAVEVDVHRFTALAGGKQNAPDQLAEAVALYRGDFLADFYLPDSEPFEEWAAARRADLRRHMLEALDSLTASTLEGKDYGEATAYARRQLEIDSLRESAHRQLMLALAGSGQRSDALAQYETCRRLLHDELGVEPEAETRILVERIAAGQEQRSSSAAMLPSIEKPRDNLPLQLSSFIGRGREVAEIRQLLSASRLLTLTGAGGSGKTRLALKTAEGLPASFGDGVRLVELAPLSDPTLVAAVVAATLGMIEDKDRPVVDALVDYLRNREMLLLLDNCEHLIDAAAQLAETLLRHCPKLHILATSREALNIAGEVVWLAPTLSLPPPGELPSLEDIGQYDAVRLFVERATAALPTFNLTEHNAAAVVQCCRQLDGIPLAIELVAARVRLLRVEQIVARLDDRFRLLAGGNRAASPRHQTLRALIDWSYDLLSSAEQRLLRRLSVFAGGLTLEAAEAICDKENEGDVLESLTQLASKSLVVADRASGQEARYDLHETIRQYAWARLQEVDEVDRLLARHADYYCGLAEQAHPGLYLDERLVRREWWEMEQDNFRAVLSRVYVGRILNLELGLALTARLIDFWWARGSIREMRYWLEPALETMNDAAVPIRAALYLGAGAVWYQQGGEQSSLLLRKSLELYREIEDKDGTSGALFHLGVIAADTDGDYEQAVSLYEQSLELLTGLDVDSRRITKVIAPLAYTAMRMGRYGYAMEQIEKGLMLARKASDRQATVGLLRSQGALVMRQRDYRRAMSSYLEALELAREAGAKGLVSFALNDLGEATRHQGAYEQALAFYRESLALARELGWLRTIPIILDNMGHATLRGGDPQQAVAFFRESLSPFREKRPKAGLVWNLWGFATSAGMMGQAERAARLYAAAKPLWIDIPEIVNLPDYENYERDVALLHSQLGETAFTVAWAEGQAMSLDEAISYALEEQA